MPDRENHPVAVLLKQALAEFDLESIVVPSKDEVLKRLDTLHFNADVLDVDFIDGEFYWRCCRINLLAPAASFLKVANQYMGPQILADTDGLLHSFRRTMDFLQIAWIFDCDFGKKFPPRVYHGLTHHMPIPMREPCTSYKDISKRPTEVLRVMSGGWTGRDVEQYLAELPPHDDSVENKASKTLVKLRNDISFKLVTGPGNDSPTFQDEFSTWPYVEVRVSYPFPIDGVVASHYDTFVRERNQWHLLLRSGAKRQDRIVAIRTWAVGLLMAGGQKFGDAMRLVHETADIEEVSQPRFGQDRQRLIARVPEARPFLYARDEQAPALAKAS